MKYFDPREEKSNRQEAYLAHGIKSRSTRKKSRTTRKYFDPQEKIFDWREKEKFDRRGKSFVDLLDYRG